MTVLGCSTTAGDLDAGMHSMSGRVLVTGGAGFIGSHIAEAYLRQGWEVVVLDDLSRGHEGNVPKGARFVRADIRSAEARQTLATGRFDVLNHHAAQIDVRVSVDRPAFDSDINVVGFVNLLEGAGEGGVKRVIFASSGGVLYGDPEVIPTPETAPKSPISPYGVSKLAGEHYLRALGALRGFEGIAMRYANVFGPRQDPKSEAGVVSIFVSRLLAKQPLIVFGDGRQTRDYVFVKDVARANVLASTASASDGGGLDGPAFNIATSVQRSVLDLATSVGEVMGQKPKLEFAPPRAGELSRSALDVGKAKKVLGWKPEYGFEDGLRELVDWFKKEAR
jgi:UDP-glucose 4-epimerase